MASQQAGLDMLMLITGFTGCRNGTEGVRAHVVLLADVGEAGLHALYDPPLASLLLATTQGQTLQGEGGVGYSLFSKTSKRIIFDIRFFQVREFS